MASQDCRWERGPASAITGKPVHWAQLRSLTSARVADEVKTDAKEEANVEFQRCGPQNTRSGQGGQTHKSDGAGRQTGLRCLRHSGSEGGGGQIRQRGV